MNETLFKIAESATSSNYILFTLIITIISSLIVALIFYKSIKKTILSGIICFVISETIFLIILFF